MKKACLILAVLSALMIPIWIFGILPQILWRIPPGWSQQIRCIGYQNLPDPATHQWTKEISMVYEREKKIIKEDRNKRRGELSDRYTTYDPISGKATWEYIPVYTIDLKTGVLLEGKDRQGYYYCFPLHTRKITYTLTREYFKKLPFTFVKEDNIEGLKVYLFEFRGITEYTESYTGSDKYPGVIPPSGQEIRTTDSFMVRYWVEPVSGVIVSLEENCSDGDWIVDAKTGEKISPLFIWGGKTTGDAVIQLVDTARKRKQEILLKERYIPIGFGLLAVVFFLGGVLFTSRKKESLNRS
jgi:hypothetical protein